MEVQTNNELWQPQAKGSNASVDRRMQVLQLSHEELLLLLALARLPMPLSLGEQPFEGHTEATLNVALASATSSLIVRGLLIPADRRAQVPTIVDGVEPLLMDLALAEACLLVASRRQDQVAASAYTLRGSTVVCHTNPVERIHRLERLSDSAAIVDRLLQDIEPHTPDAAPLNFALDADALGLAVEAIAANRVESARGILLTAGVDAATVEEFLQRAEGDIGRYTLMVFSNLRSRSPVLNGTLILRGKTETWLVNETQDTSVNIQTIALPVLQTELHTLVQHMTKASAS